MKLLKTAVDQALDALDSAEHWRSKVAGLERECDNLRLEVRWLREKMTGLEQKLDDYKKIRKYLGPKAMNELVEQARHGKSRASARNANNR